MYADKAKAEGIIIERDESTFQDRRIVLGRMPRAWQEWGTWVVYPTCDGLTSGHYFTNEQDAHADLTARVQRGY